VININELSGGTLAYLGDAYWSLLVRDYLINQGVYRPMDLQIKSIKMVSAKAQRKIYEYLLNKDFLTEEEQSYFKRGRNYSSKSYPKNTDVITYRYSTGFEALIGYLYIEKDFKRLNTIFDEVKKMEII